MLKLSRTWTNAGAERVGLGCGLAGRVRRDAR